jgi:Protein of unknown function (DUF3987)
MKEDLDTDLAAANTNAATDKGNTQGVLFQHREYFEHLFPDIGERKFLNIHWKTSRINPGTGKPWWGGRACRTIEEACSLVAWARCRSDIMDIYACTSTQRQCIDKVSKKGMPYRLPVRSSENAIAVNHLRFDLDTKGQDRNSYNSREEALAAFEEFRKIIGFPRPSMIVDSGGGYHIYYRFDRSLIPEEWQPLADALVESTKCHGLKCDTQVTTDLARLLRVAGTFNHKPEYGQPQPVQIVGTIIKDGYSVADIEKVLAPYIVATPWTAARNNVLNFPPRPQLPGESDLSAGLKVNLNEIRSAALAVPPAAISSEEDWMNKLARPLAHTASIYKSQADGIYEILKEASARAGAGKYDETENRTRFDRYVAESFNHERPITISTLFDVAKKYNWKGWQPETVVQMSMTSPATASEGPGAKWASEHSSSGDGPCFADPYAEFVGPAFPFSILPPVLNDFVNAQHRAMGADPAAIAMSAIAAVAGAASAETRIQAGSSWDEPPIIWVGIIGLPSAMKTPVIDKVTKPLRRIDTERDRAWRAAHSAWQQAKSSAAKGSGAPPGPEPKKPGRAIIDDVTAEKAAEILSRDPSGVLMVQDELAGFIDSFERYGNGAASRGFFLQSYNGGSYLKDRVGQGDKDKYAEIRVENLAIGVLGGIQPDRLSKLRNLTDDGLMQRFLPVAMQPAERGDENYPVAIVEMEYERLIRSVNAERARTYVFAPDAKDVRKRVLDKLHQLEQGGAFSQEMGGAIGKLKGYFSRLALTLEIADSHSAAVRDNTPPSPNAIVSRKNAEHAERLIFEFLLQHIFGLYDVIVGGGKDRDVIRAIADFILASTKDRLVPSDFTSSVRKLRGEPANKIAEWASRFVALGWLWAEGDIGTVKAWQVVPGLRSVFAERREKAKAGRAAAHEILRSMGGTKRGQR